MKSSAILVLAAAAVAMPAHAGVLSGPALLQVAQLVLKNRALLQRGQNQCGEPAALKPQESLLATAATAAVQKALPQPKFNALSLLANRQAGIAAAAPGFCDNAVRARPGLVGQIAGAAQQLGVGGELGLLAGALGGNAAPSTGDAAAAALGGLLGK